MDAGRSFAPDLAGDLEPDADGPPEWAPPPGRRLHILFLTDNFPPEVNAPATRTFEHAREWVRRGHAVTIVTGAPNFPNGRIFAGYRNRPFQRERMDGIEIIRVWTYVTANEGLLRRSLDYASFMATGTLAALAVRKADLVVATSPQIFTALAGCLVSRLKRVPFVFELRDLWPESIRAVGALRDGYLLRLLERMEMALYRRASRIVCVTRAFCEHLIDRGIEGGRIGVVTNGVDLLRFAARPRDADLETRYRLKGRFVAGYVGTHGMAHGLDTVIDAARVIEARGIEDVTILLLGSGAARARLARRVAEEGIGNVLMLETVPKAEIAAHWSLLDLALIHLRDEPVFRTVIPSKLFECMAMGRPVVHAVSGESAAIVEEAECGLVVPSEDPEAMADAILRFKGDRSLRERMGENGQKAAVRFDRTRLAGRMLDEFHTLFSDRAP